MVDIDLYAWIIRGARRTAILKAMEKPMSPCQIHKKSKQEYEENSVDSHSVRSMIALNEAQQYA